MIRSTGLQRIRLLLWMDWSWPRVTVSVFLAATCASLFVPAADAQLIGTPAPAALRIANHVVGVGPSAVSAALSGDTTGICARTSQVGEAIVARIDGITDCADVTNTHLAGITDTLDLSSSEITSLSEGDFAGLSSVRLLNLYDNDLTTLPSGLLSGMSNLRVLYLDNNALTALPADLLVPARKLNELWVRNNDLTELPAGFFSGIPSRGFNDLHLYNNPGDPALKHLNVCWARTYCAGGAPLPIEFSLQALGQGRFQVVVPIGTPFDLKVALEVTNGTLADDTVTIPVGRVESDTVAVTRAAGTVAAVTVDIVDLRATSIDPRRLRTRGGQEHVLPQYHAGVALVKAAGLPVEVLPRRKPQVTIVPRNGADTVTEGTAAAFTLTRGAPRDSALAVTVGVTQTGEVIGTADGYEAPTGVEFPAGDSTVVLTVQTQADAVDETNGGITASVTAGADSPYRVGAPASATVVVADDDERPGAPTGLGATAGDAFVTLAWTAPGAVGTSPIAGYQYQQKEGGGSYGDWVDIGDSAPRETHAAGYTVTGLTNGTVHAFKVRAVSDAGAGEASGEATATPVPPDPDGTREGATRLTATPRRTVHRLVTDALDRAAGDTVDYYVFTLSERQVLGLGVRDQTIDLDATLEDASGNALMKSWPPPADATVEWLKTTLDAGTYYIRVEAAEDGATEYRIRFGLEDPPPPAPAAPEVTGPTSFTVTEGETAVGTLSATDEDTPAEDLEWSLAGGADESKFALTAAGAVSFGSAKDYENPDDGGTDGTYEVTVEVSDGTHSDTADVTVTLANRNEAPSADAGSDQTGIEGGATATLSGSGSDPDAGDTLSYVWSQTAGTSVTLASASSAQATFTAPPDLTADDTLTFRLRVADSGGLFAEDETDVTVLAAPGDPVVSVVAVATPVAEGSKAEFSVSRTGPTTEDLTVRATWAHSDLTETTTTSLRFHPGRSTIGPYTHRSDDKVVREDRTVTLTLQDGEGYVLSEEAGSAQVVVEENDTANFALSLKPAQVAEGASSTVRVTITNPVTFGAAQTIALDFDGGTAARGTDYTVSADSLTLRAGASSADATVTTSEDGEREEGETVSVTARHAGRTIGTGTITIVDAATASSDPDATRAGATRLTATPRRTVHRLVTDSLDRAAGDSVDYYVFTLSERQVLGLGVRDQTIDLDATLEDASGTALMKSWPPPVDPTVEWLKTTLDPATYYIRVEATEDGATEYRIRFGLEDPASSASASAASDGEEVEVEESAALQRLGDLTPEAAAAALFGETELGEARLEALDRLGNRNGRYDLGDLLSWRARCGRGEARCGRTSVPSGAAAAIVGAIAARGAAAGLRRPPRRRKTARRRRGRGPSGFRSAAAWLRILVLALAGTWSCGLGDDPVQPQSADAPLELEPGRLLVTLAVPSGARAAGAMIVIEGPGIDSLRALGGELIEPDESSATERAAIVAGALGNGPVLEIWVPHVADHGHYRARLLQVAAADYRLRDPTEYAVMISR